MPSPDDRRYAKTHEWHKPEGDLVVIGISKFAVDELTDITFLDITKTQGQAKAGETFGEIESVKTTSDLYAGIDGQVVEVNQEAIDNPGIINDDPYEQGWMIKIKPDDPSQVEQLMNAGAYDAQVGQ